MTTFLSLDDTTPASGFVHSTAGCTASGGRVAGQDIAGMAPRAVVFTLANPDPEVAPLLLPVFGQPALRPVGDIVDSVEQTLNGHVILQDRNRPGLGVDQTQVQWVPVTNGHQSILRADVAVHHHGVTSLEVPVQPFVKMFEGVADRAALQQRTAFDAVSYTH